MGAEGGGESLIELQNTLITTVSHIPALNASHTQYEPLREKKKKRKKKHPVPAPECSCRGNYHQAPLHLCTNNPTAAGIDTVYAERSRESPG